jgi:hypothetical protein
VCREVVRITSYHICLPPGVPHLPPPFRSGQGGLNTSLMKGVIATRSRLPPAGTKPDRSGLTASRRTGISASYCCVRASYRVLTSKIRDRPRSNILDEPLGGRKRGPDRVMRLDWGFIESTHHTARTVGYSGEFCTRRSNRFLFDLSTGQLAAGAVLP